MEELMVEVRQTPGKITCNFDEIEAALRTQMQAYEELEVTEDNIPERKKDVATLRKIKDAVDGKRKEVKKTFSQPLTEFEARVKKITGILDEQILRINQGLDAFEKKRIKEKEAHIAELYGQEMGDYAEFLPLDAISSPKWLNKTCSDNEIVSAMQEMKQRVRNDLDVIRGLGSDIEDKLIAAYKANGNTLAVAIRKNTEYLEAKRAAEERVRAEEERRAREKAEAEARAAEEAQRAADTEAVEVVLDDAPFAMETVTVKPEAMREESFEEFSLEPTLTIRVTGEENISMLRELLGFSEIEYEEV